VCHPKRTHHAPVSQISKYRKVLSPGHQVVDLIQVDGPAVEVESPIDLRAARGDVVGPDLGGHHRLRPKRGESDAEDFFCVAVHGGRIEKSHARPDRFLHDFAAHPDGLFVTRRNLEGAPCPHSDGTARDL